MNRSLDGDLLEVLIDPTDLAVRVGRAEPPSLERGFAMLLDARFAEYERLAPEAGWPSIGAAVEGDASAFARLLSGLALQLSGAAEAANRLRDLASDAGAPTAVRVVAAALGSIAFRDAGRPDIALELLVGISSDSPAQRALLLLHQSVAERELGNAAAALDSALAAEDLLTPLERPTEVESTLAAIAARNTSAFAFVAGRSDLMQRLTPRSPALDRIESRSQHGLSSWLDQEFDGRLQDPSQTTITFRQEDPVETPLIAALLRAEALADWYLTNDARRRLGRYQLLASVGVADRAPVPAMYLLRRSADTKGLRQALRWYVAQGPLPPVREFGDSVAVSPWGPVSLQCDLVALAETADVMSQPAANIALARLLASVGELLGGVPGARLESEVNNAIASLLPVTSDGSSEVAGKFVALVSQSSDPLFLQSVGRVFGRIDWDQVDPAVLDEWRKYAVAHLDGASDHRFAAAELIRVLPNRGGLRLSALDAFERQPDILTAVNALAFGPVSKSVARRIATLARGHLREVRESAAQGSHGFGAFVDTPLLLTHLLMDNRGLSGWADLVRFLLDPNVSPSRKTGPLTEVLRRPEAVPAFVHARLAAWASRPVMFNKIPMDSIEEFKAVVLRVRFRYRAKSIDALLAELVEMATSPERAARREAALSLRFALETAPPATLITLGLTLSRDPAWEIRGAAAGALPRIAAIADEPLASMGWRRVAEALRDPGSQVPLWVLSGLDDSTIAAPSPEVRDLIQEISVTHLSHRVRSAASRLAVARAATSPGAAPSSPLRIRAQ